MPKRDSVLTALGQKGRRRREARELKKEKLGERSGLDSTCISGIERGLRNPGIKNVAKLAKALGLCHHPSAPGSGELSHCFRFSGPSSLSCFEKVISYQ